MPEPQDTPAKSPSRPGDSDEHTTSVGHFFHQAERLVYILVAALLLVAAVGTCLHAAFAAWKETRESGHLLPALFTLLSDLLLVLIILELLRTVGRFIRKEEPGVGVADLTPFLIVAAISATRRLLAIGANLSITESQLATRGQSGATVPALEPEHFRQAMIELGINGALVLVITFSLLMIGRNLQTPKEMAQGDEVKSGGGSKGS